VFDAAGGQEVSDVVGAQVGVVVVRDQPFDGDAESGELVQGAGEEPGGGGAFSSGRISESA
jgi:hypothetical protein